jgi:hypothetical protein
MEKSTLALYKPAFTYYGQMLLETGIYRQISVKVFDIAF